MLLSKQKKACVVLKKDLEVLADVMGVSGPGEKQPSWLNPQLTDTKLRQMSMLDGKIYWPGKIPYWEMKEGQEKSRYPNLLKALAMELDPSCRRSIWERFRTQTDSQVGSRTVQNGVTSQ